MRLPSSRPALAALAALLALLAPAGAAAFNPETTFLSTEAALTGGAVLAGDDEGGAGWYNPASLAAVGRTSLQLGASVYSVSAFHVQDALVTELPWTTLRGDGEDTAFGSVPAVLALTWKVRDGLGVSAGIWTPFHGSHGTSLNDLSTGPFPGAAGIEATYRQDYSWSTSSDDTWVGVAAGWQAAAGLRLGAALQGAYTTASSVVDLDTSLETGSADPLERGEHVNVSIRSDVSALAGRALLGLQWDVAPGVWLAAALRSPSWRVHAWGDTTRLISYAVLLPGYAPQIGQLVEHGAPAAGVSTIDVGRVSAGLRWERGGWSARVDWGWSPALDRTTDGARASWNLRAGLLRVVDRDLTVGLGAFREGTRNLASQGALAVDMYGLAGGVSYRPSKVVQALGGGSDWDLLTGLGARVAYGEGLGPGMILRPFALSSSQLPILVGETGRGFLEVPARAFDGSLHVFTSLAF
jgi:hypothetical protein